MIDHRNTPKEVLELIREVCIAFTGASGSNAVPLLLGTAAVEGNLKKRGQIIGPARGLWQMEPVTALDIWDRFIQYENRWLKVLGGFSKSYPVDHFPSKKELATLLYEDDKFACCMARMNYLRFPEPIPGSLQGQATYWKHYWNTSKGKGTEKKYLKAWISNHCDSLLSK